MIFSSMPIYSSCPTRVTTSATGSSLIRIGFPRVLPTRSILLSNLSNFQLNSPSISSINRRWTSITTDCLNTTPVGWHDEGERQSTIDGITIYLYIERFSHTCYSYLHWLWTTHFNTPTLWKDSAISRNNKDKTTSSHPIKRIQHLCRK